MHTILLRPLITEKSLTLAGRGWFTFAVSRDSRKPEIAQAVKDEFRVHVTGVRTVTVSGKSKRVGRKRLEKAGTDWKKALVRLKTGEKIDLFTVETPPQAVEKK